jgi:MFS family permease
LLAFGRDLVWPNIPPGGSATDYNLAHMRVGPIWSAPINAAIAFNSAFAIRLGASNQLIGLLSSMPALLTMLLTLPAAQFIESRPNRLRLMSWSLFAYRMGYLAISLMPFFLTSYRAEAFVALILLMNVIVAPFNAGWNAMLADLIPEGQRAPIFAWRNITYNAGVAVCTPLAGRLLDALAFPYGYQLAYAIGFSFALVNTWFIMRLRPPELPAPTKTEAKTRFRLAQVRQFAVEHAPYTRMILNTLAFDMGAWLVGPLYMIYYLRHLGANNAWVGTLTSISTISVMAGYYLWQRVIRRWGESRTLKVTVPAGALYPLIAGLTPVLWPLLIAALFNGLIAPGINLSHFNILLKACPSERRATYLSLYTVTMNAGAFVCPMLGVALADRIGFPPVFLIGAGLRLLGAFLFTLWPVRVPDKTP